MQCAIVQCLSEIYKTGNNIFVLFNIYIDNNIFKNFQLLKPITLEVGISNQKKNNKIDRSKCLGFKRDIYECL